MKESCFLPTYKHRFEDYNAEDVLLVDQPPYMNRMLSVRMQCGDSERRVKCANTNSTADALTRIYDGGFKYGCIIAPKDSLFIKRLRQKPYKGVVLAIGPDVNPGEAFAEGYDGLVRNIDRETMMNLVNVFQDIFKIEGPKPKQRQLLTYKSTPISTTSVLEDALIAATD